MTRVRRPQFTLTLVGLLAVAACSESRDIAGPPALDGATSVETSVVDTSGDATATTGSAPTTTPTPSVATICIRSNIDFAALRLAADRAAELVAEIPPGSCDVFVLDLPAVQGNGFDWYHVQWNGITGYTAADNAESLTMSPGTIVTLDVSDPEFIFTQIVNWNNYELDEYAGDFSDPTCTKAWLANFVVERLLSDDVDAAIAGLTSLSIPISDELRTFIERSADIFQTYGADLLRISNKYFDDSEEAARSDTAYASVAAAFLERYIDAPDDWGTMLVDRACRQFQLGD